MESISKRLVGNMKRERERMNMYVSMRTLLEQKMCIETWEKKLRFKLKDWS